MRASLRFWTLAIPCLLIAATAGLQSAPVGKGEGKTVSAIDDIKKALDSNATLDFANQSLPTVLSAIGDDSKISIVLDRAAIQSSGMEPNEMMVDVHLKNTKLRNGLRTLLGQYNLSFGIVGDHVFVSTEEAVINRQLKQRINVEVEDKPLSTVVKDLGKRYGINILLDPRCTKQKKTDDTVSLSLEDVPFETVVRLACEIGNLKPVRLGNVLFVTTEERADKLRDQDLAPASNPGGYPGVINPNLGGIGLGAPVPMAIPNPPPVPPVVEKD